MNSVKSQILLIALILSFPLFLLAKADNDRLIIESFSKGVDEKGVPGG